MVELLSQSLCMPCENSHRYYHENTDTERTPFQKDRDRIIHCTAFRRLQYKTQVFVYHEGDHYRTRLTHSLEVSQIARSIAYRLHGNCDLVEALALAHDIGHPAFAHAGERRLKKLMENYGGFDHNAQSFLILTEQEKRYADFDGLNLTDICLEGLLKHNGLEDFDNADFKHMIAHSPYLEILDLTTYPYFEAQIASVSDDIAYCSHDLDDALRAGLISMNDLRDIHFLNMIIETILKEHPNISDDRLRYTFIRRLVTCFIDDVVHTCRQIIKKNVVTSYDMVQKMRYPCVTFSDDMYKNVLVMKNFLFENMYDNKIVRDVMTKAENIIDDLFHLYFQHPHKLPVQWQDIKHTKEESCKARHICHFIAGMTDRFAIKEHRKHC